ERRAELQAFWRDDPAWHEEQLRQAEAARDQFAAAFHLKCLLLLKPDDPGLLERSGRLHAENGRWPEAGADFTRLAQRDPDPDRTRSGPGPDRSRSGRGLPGDSSSEPVGTRITGPTSGRFGHCSRMTLPEKPRFRSRSTSPRTPVSSRADGPVNGGRWESR